MILAIDMSSGEVLESSEAPSTKASELAWDPKLEGLRLAEMHGDAPSSPRLASVLPADLFDIDPESFVEAVRRR
jgi:hypothetical protein